MSNKNKNKGKNQSDEEEEEQGEYTVEKICGMRVNPKTKRKEYFVKWENYPESDNTWEPISNLRKVMDLVEQFDLLQKENNTSKSIVVTNKKGSQSELKSQQEILSKPSSKNKQDKPRMSSDYEQSSYVEEDEQVANDDYLHEHKQKQTEFKKTSSANSVQKTGKTSSQIIEVNEKKLSKFDEDLCEQEDQEVGESNVSEPQFIFEKILDRRTINGSYEYLVKFENISSNNWVPESELEGFEKEIQDFNKQFELQQQQQLQQKKTSTREREEVVQQQQKSKSKSVSNYEQAKEKVSNVLKTHQPQPQEINPKLKEKNMKDQQIDLYETDSLFEQTSKCDTNSLFEDPLPSHSVANKKTQNSQSSHVNKKEFKFEKEDFKHNQKEDTTQNPKMHQMAETRQKRTFENAVSSNVIGDFKTDNYEKLVLQGEVGDVMQSRIEVYWRKRADGTVPQSQVYSSTYLRKYEPNVFIDLLINKITNI